MFPNACEHCRTAPQGIEGHPTLQIERAVPEPKRAGTLFRCADCEARWVRAYAGSGHFQWIPDSPSP